MNQLKLLFVLALSISTAYAQETLVFERDMRPVDGPYHAITLTPYADEASVYSVTHKVITVSRMSGVQEREYSIADSIECTIEKDYDVITQVVCLADDRAIDGAYTKLTISKNSENTFDAHLIKLTNVFGEVNLFEQDIARNLNLIK